EDEHVDGILARRISRYVEPIPLVALDPVLYCSHLVQLGGVRSGDLVREDAESPVERRRRLQVRSQVRVEARGRSRSQLVRGEARNARDDRVDRVLLEEVREP